MKLKVQLYDMQIGGFGPKLVTENRQIVLKDSIFQQLHFYQHLSSLKTSDLCIGLFSFIPKFYGTILSSQFVVLNEDFCYNSKNKTQQWLQYKRKFVQIQKKTKEYLLLENFVKNFHNPNIIDIKIGAQHRRQGKFLKKQRDNYFALHGYRVSFYCTKQKQPETIFLSKYSFVRVINNDQDVLIHLAIFFFDGQKIRTELLKNILEKLKQLILQLKCLQSWKLFSSSICIYYQPEKELKFGLKLIDFARSKHIGSFVSQEQASISGLENLHRFFLQILQKAEQLQPKIISLVERYICQPLSILPQ